MSTQLHTLSALYFSSYLCNRVRSKRSPEAWSRGLALRGQHEQALGEGEGAGVGEKRAQLRLGQREVVPGRRDDRHVYWQGERERRLQEGWRD